MWWSSLSQANLTKTSLADNGDDDDDPNESRRNSTQSLISFVVRLVGPSSWSLRQVATFERHCWCFDDAAMTVACWQLANHGHDDDDDELTSEQFYVRRLVYSFKWHSKQIKVCSVRVLFCCLVRTAIQMSENLVTPTNNPLSQVAEEDGREQEKLAGWTRILFSWILFTVTSPVLIM